MGSLIVVTGPRDEADGSATAALRGLGASPHRGSVVTTRSTGSAFIAIANHPGDDEASVAARNGAVAGVVGSLDNAEELDRELDRLGCAPGERGAAGTVLRAHTRWGHDAFRRLRGAVAGVVVDDHDVCAFRDHIGFRTIYVGRDGGTRVFASEAKQVAAATGRGRRPDHEALELLFRGRLPENRTTLLGIERLPRASVAVQRGEGRPLTVSRYWDPRDLVESSSIGPDEALEQLVLLLAQATERAVTGNDAVLLSGGIDSPAIAAFAASPHLARSGRPLTAVSAVYPDHPTVDERTYIQLVVDRLDLEFRPYVPKTYPLDDIDDWVDLLDTPVCAFHVPGVAESYRAVSDAGGRNVLTGEFAEYVYGFRRHTLGHLLLRGRAGAAWDHARSLHDRGYSWRAVARRIAPTVTPAAAASAYLKAKALRRPPTWYRPEGRWSPPRPDLEYPIWRRWTEQQLDPLRAAPLTLDAAEHLASYYGLTVRRPFADVDLWEFFLSLRAETKFPDPIAFKTFIRDGIRDRLPAEVVDRRDKTLFDAYLMGNPGYGELRRWLDGTQFRLPCVDYTRLRDHLDREDLTLPELILCNELAAIHAFVERLEA